MPTITPPTRSLTQQRAALEVANDVRSKRAKLKRDLAARRAQIVPLLDDPPDWLLTAKVSALLLSLPGIGRVKAALMLDRRRIAWSKTVGGMTARQRAELVVELRARDVR